MRSGFCVGLVLSQQQELMTQYGELGDRLTAQIHAEKRDHRVSLGVIHHETVRCAILFTTYISFLSSHFNVF